MESPIIYPLALEAVHCPTCGATFCVSQSFVDQRRRDGRRIYCPSGHRLYFPPTPRPATVPAEVRTLKRQLIRAVHQAEQAEARAASKP